MSKYYDCEGIVDSLERIARSLELLLSAEDLKAKFDEKMKELHEEAKKEEVEELAEEEVKEPIEALKEAKEPSQDTFMSLQYAKELVDSGKVEVSKEEKEELKKSLKEVKDQINVEELAKMRDSAHKEAEAKLKAPVKRGNSRQEIRKHRISPYRIKEQGKKASSSGFRIKED